MRRSSVSPVLLFLGVLSAGREVLAEEFRSQRFVDVIVTAGQVDVQDWVLEQPVQVSALDPPATQAAVYELDSKGAILGQKTSQFDMEAQFAVITWIADGVLPAGSRRFFRIQLDKAAPPSPASGRLSARREKDIVIVEGPGGVSVRHDTTRAGVLTEAQVGQASVRLIQDDLLGDPELNYYKMEHDRRARSRIVASGPIRAAIEVEASYVDSGGVAPISSSRGRYRYTYITVQGMLVIRLQATLSQDSAKQWREVEVGQFRFGQQFSSWVLNIPNRHGLSKGALIRGGFWHSADRWGVVYNEALLFGIVDATWGVDILDDKDASASCLLRSAPTRWDGLLHERTVHILLGRGPRNMGRLDALARALSDPPQSRIVIPDELGARIRHARSRIAQEREELLSGPVGAFVAGEQVLASAEFALWDVEELARNGDLNAAGKELKSAVLSFETEVSHDLKQFGDFLMGRIGSSTLIGNRHASFSFADSQEGGGITSICDLGAQREFLMVRPRSVHLWEIVLKDAEGKRFFINNRSGTPDVSVRAHEKSTEAELLMRWQNLAVEDTGSALSVTVRAMLGTDDAFLRLSINVESSPELGLVSVIFPILSGIRPISEGAERDSVVLPRAFGKRCTTPLLTGQSVTARTPQAMQFIALTDGARGFYCAEEDPSGARKDLVFARSSNGKLLDFRALHPVLNWAGKELVRTYVLPGPFVLGPYRGDWFDVCRRYREWALTAPWCRGGALAVRKDIPEWVKGIPTWRPTNIGSADMFDLQEKLGGLPYAAHLYGWMKRPVEFRAGEAPYPLYFPQGGDAWFDQKVKKAQAAGIRIMPYTNGLLWWTGHERFESAGIPSAVKGADGRAFKALYSGNRFGVMCLGAPEWRQEVTSFCLGLVAKFGLDAVYLDQLSAASVGVWAMCHDETHGHPLCGGDSWVKMAKELLRSVRHSCREENPEFAVTSEAICEPLIDSLDIFLNTTWDLGSLPLFPAVYGGYALVFGSDVPVQEKEELPYPFLLSRWYIWGAKGGWNGIPLRDANNDPEVKMAQKHLRMLLACYENFARSFLTYGQMLRPPVVKEGVPHLLSRRGQELQVPSVEAMAWQAPDKRIAIFVANYSDAAHTVTWRADLWEEPDEQSVSTINVRRWNHETLALEPVGAVAGRSLRRTDRIRPYGLLILELAREEQ